MPAQRSPAPQLQQNGAASEAGDTSTFVNQTPPPSKGSEATNGHSYSLHPMTEEEDSDDIGEYSNARSNSLKSTRPRVGTMNKDFRIPSPSPTSPKQGLPDHVPPVPSVPPSVVISSPSEVAPPEPTPTHEVPPPPPVEKERERVQDVDHEDVGETEEIDLN